MTVFLTHHMTKLALHTLRGGGAPNLLLLHALGEQSPSCVPDDCEGWPGAIYALDFTGHGQSAIPAGGGYTAEVLMGDADAALGVIGEVTLVGRGLGAWIALMLAAGRPDLVRGAVLDDGAGLAGGGDEPGPLAVRGVPNRQGPPDPFALIELSADLRPRDYAAKFAEIAVAESAFAEPIAVTARARTDWLRAVLAQGGVVERANVAEALQGLARR